MAEQTRGPTSNADTSDPFQSAMSLANEFYTAEFDNYQKGRDDQAFYIGAQWDEMARQEREQANRPVITINRIPGFVRQVTGDVRKDTPAIKVAPSKDGASQEVADIFNGIIRNIEDQSNAKAAYVQGVENACVTGLGAFRVKTVYSSDDAFEQDVRIERFGDPFQVLFDPAAKEPDKSDGRATFIFIDLPKAVFEKEFPDAAPDSMPNGPNGERGLVWWALDTVRVAEYWYKKPAKKALLLLSDGRVISAEQALKETQEGQPIDVVEKRDIKTFEICMRLMSGKEFLTEENKWAGKYIPIVPVIGEENFVNGAIVRKGMVRDAKDAQRVLNYATTASVEAAALQPKMPWLVTKDMISGLESHWGELGRKNLPYAVYKPDKMAPGAKPERAQPALAQNGLDQLAQVAANDLQAIIGIYNVSLGAPSSETSGRAILARQKQGDTGTYVYIDNLGTAIRYCGKILVDLIPKIYDTPRIVRTIKEDGQVEMAPINHPVDEQGQQVDSIEMAVKRMNDLSVGEYDVTVVTGPSFATKRMETAETTAELITKAPELMKVAGDILIGNMDIPGGHEIAERLKRGMPRNILEDSPEPPPPPPQLVAELAKTASEVRLNDARTEEMQVKAVGEAVGVSQMLQQMRLDMATFQQTLLQALSPKPAAQAEPAAPAAPSGPLAGPVGAPKGVQNLAQFGELEPMQ